MTNPIFETSVTWDLLFDVGSSRVLVSKDIHSNFPQIPLPPPILGQRRGALKADSSLSNEEEVPKGQMGDKRTDFVAKADSADNLFIEDVSLSYLVILLLR